MKKSHQRRLFYALCAAFLAIGGIAVFYAQGWRIEPQGLKIGKIGGLYIRTFPRDTEVLLDSVPVDETPGLIESGRLVNDLFPKTYDLIITKNGYRTITTTATVRPALVTELKSTILLPEKIDVVSTSTAMFWQADMTTIEQHTNGRLTRNGNMIKGNMLVAISKHGTHSITKDTQGTIFDITDETSTPITALLQKLTKSKAPSIIGTDSADGESAIFAETSSTLFRIDLASKSAVALFEKPLGTTITDIASGQEIAWILWNPTTNISTVITYNRGTSVAKTRGELHETIHLEGWLGDRLVIRTQSNAVAVNDPKTNNWNTLANDAIDTAIDIDRNTVAVLERDAIEIFAPPDSAQPYRKFSLNNLSVAAIAWHRDGGNLVLLYPTTALFNVETGGILQTIASDTLVAHYNPETSVILFVSDGALRRITLPR